MKKGVSFFFGVSEITIIGLCGREDLCLCHTPLDRQASTRKTATTEFEGEAVLILTLFLRSSDRDSSDNAKTRNISRTSNHRAGLRCKLIYS